MGCTWKQRGIGPGRWDSVLSDCMPVVYLRTFVNDWIKRKYKQESKLILENHQAKFLWSRARRAKELEHFNNANNLAITDFCHGYSTQ